ncbi:MAG TPA: sigma-70 family RNA polymerase sigma factor [Nocardioidaceae bacterium]|nr:sigma-70 family RNA polymerase sigma factor [Nocardioidaceae bacterium]
MRSATPVVNRPGDQEAPLLDAGQARSSEDRRAVTARLLRRAAETTDTTERQRLQDEVVVLNMGIARAIAARYRGKGIADEDLTQAAYIALLKAARGFDPSFEREFLSYAIPTIQGEVKRQFRDYGWMVRPPRPIQKLQGEVSVAMNDLTQTLGRSPRISEVAELLEVPIEDVVEALSADGCYTPTSLDTPLGEAGSGTLGELISAEDHEMTAAEARVMLAPAVQKLGERDRRVLYLRFFKQQTQAQIASDIGVTQMQVCRILARVLNELRGHLD